jgi:hypothetical protein
MKDKVKTTTQMKAFNDAVEYADSILPPGHDNDTPRELVAALMGHGFISTALSVALAWQHIKEAE